MGNLLLGRFNPQINHFLITLPLFFSFERNKEFEARGLRFSLAQSNSSDWFTAADSRLAQETWTTLVSSDSPLSNAALFQT
ncbi:hypothetical protein V6N13_100029 [Hibiscus sabdariffa]